MDTNRLWSFMKLHGDTATALASYLNIARSTLSAKMNDNGAEFTQGEIQMIKERYDLSAEEVDLTFFKRKVSKLDTNKETS